MVFLCVTVSLRAFVVCLCVFIVCFRLASGLLLFVCVVCLCVLIVRVCACVVSACNCVCGVVSARCIRYVVCCGVIVRGVSVCVCYCVRFVYARLTACAFGTVSGLSAS